MSKPVSDRLQAAAVLLVATCGCAAPQAPAEPPRGIVLLLADRPEGAEVEPVDRLLPDDEAMVDFLRHYTTSPDPTRAAIALLTGRFGDGSDGVPRSLGERFGAAGHRTYAAVGIEAIDSMEQLGFRRTFDNAAEATPALLADAIAGEARPYLAVVDAGPRAAAFVSELRESGLLADALLVLTRDVGRPDRLPESPFHDSIVRVPLKVRFPQGTRPRTLAAMVRRITRHIDLAPSLLRHAGIDGAGELPGVNVLNGRTADHALMESAAGWALVVDNHKLVRRADGTLRLFDLAADPDEREDLALRYPQRVEALRGMAAGFRRSLTGVDPEADPTLEELRSLGYIQ